MPIPSKTLAVLLAAAMAATTGCATTGDASRDAAAESTRTAGSPVSDFFARFGVRATSGDDPTMYRESFGPKTELDPARRISEQDCRKPIVLDGGNLRCK